MSCLHRQQISPKLCCGQGPPLLAGSATYMSVFFFLGVSGGISPRASSSKASQVFNPGQVRDKGTAAAMGPGGKRWPEAGRALWVPSPPGWNEGRRGLVYLGCGKLKGSHLSSPGPFPFPALLGERCTAGKRLSGRFLSQFSEGSRVESGMLISPGHVARPPFSPSGQTTVSKRLSFHAVSESLLRMGCWLSIEERQLPAF